MGKDYRVGLIAGLVLVIAAMIWVATRPSLSPQARLREPARLLSQDQPATNEVLKVSRQALPPGLAVAEPETPRTTSTTASLPTPASIPSASSATGQPNVPDLTIYEQKEKIKTTKFHIVRRNESLSSISQQHYGTATTWPKILQANRDVIKDANQITPGTKLIIPD